MADKVTLREFRERYRKGNFLNRGLYRLKLDAEGVTLMDKIIVFYKDLNIE